MLRIDFSPRLHSYTVRKKVHKVFDEFLVEFI